jgi:hypothetical protein
MTWKSDAEDDPADGPTTAAAATTSPPAFGAADGLSSRQGRAIEALLREPTATRAAVAAGVSERTIRRWGREPAFRDALLRARRDAFGQAVGLTQRYAPVAVATLVKVMQDPAAGASAKVAAAGVLLRFGREGVELDDLAARLDRLEERAAAPARPVVSRTVGEPQADDRVDDDDDAADLEDDAGDEPDDSAAPEDRNDDGGGAAGEDEP